MPGSPPSAPPREAPMKPLIVTGCSALTQQENTQRCAKMVQLWTVSQRRAAFEILKPLKIPYHHPGAVIINLFRHGASAVEAWSEDRFGHC